MILFALVCASAQTTQSPLPAPTGYVNDFAKVIDAGTKQQLETTLTKLDQQQQIQFSVVTVDSTSGQDIFDYSLAVARGWGIGAKDAQKPSLLLLVAIKDRKYFTHVSRHLEGDLPDGLVGEIQREKLVPAFRAGNYGRGIADTIREYISTVARQRGFGTDSIVGAPSTPRRDVRYNPAANLCGIIVVLAIVILIISIFIRRGGGPGGGWVIGMILGSLLSGGRGSSSGWSSGGFGGSGGGSSGGGGFGGFGGGGDFGGGGSGGSW